MTTAVQIPNVPIAVVVVNIRIIFMCVLAVFTIIGVQKSVHGIVAVAVMPLVAGDVVGLPSHMANVSVVKRVIEPSVGCRALWAVVVEFKSKEVVSQSARSVDAFEPTPDVVGVVNGL